MNDVLISEIVRRVLDKLNVDLSDPTLVVAGVSNRHIHLTAVDVKILFGEDYTLTKLRDLRQPGQYACKETVTLVAPGGVLENVRILGPIRKSTQVEMAMSDAIRLHIDIPLIKSGSSQPCPPIIVLGPRAHRFDQRRRHGASSSAPISGWVIITAQQHQGPLLQKPLPGWGSLPRQP